MRAKLHRVATANLIANRSKKAVANVLRACLDGIDVANRVSDEKLNEVETHILDIDLVETVGCLHRLGESLLELPRETAIPKLKETRGKNGGVLGTAKRGVAHIVRGSGSSWSLLHAVR
jgi:hypothetical protein